MSLQFLPVVIKPLIESIAEKFGFQGESKSQTQFLKDMPLRLLISFQPMPFTEADLDNLLQKLNDCCPSLPLLWLFTG